MWPRSAAPSRPLPSGRELTATHGAIIVLAVLLVRWTVVLFVGTASDHAFITFRVARNLAEGHGFVYNYGADVLRARAVSDALLGPELALMAWRAGTR